MPKPKDEEFFEKSFSFLYRNLPVVIFVFAMKILDHFMFWPFAIGIAGILGYGVFGFWIPEKSKQYFLKHFAFVLLLTVAVSALAYLTIWLGWIEEK